MLTALALLASTHTPLIAYSCRYYYPAGDKRTSYHQIYLCDLHGGHRRQITFDKREHTAVRWVGRNKLAWLQSRGPESYDDRGYHDSGSPHDVVLYDLKTGQRKTVARGNYVDKLEYRDPQFAPRGLAVYFRSNTQIPVNEDTRCVLVKPGSVDLQAKLPNSQILKNRVGADEDFSAWFPCTVQQSANRRMFTVGTRSGGWDGWGALELNREGKSIDIPQEADFIWKRKDGWPGWFLVGSYASSAGSNQWIYKLDWDHHRCVQLTDGTLDIDFDPASRYWAASSNDKGGARLGKMNVWARDLWVGDATTGKQWPIASGTVSGDCARVQPE